MSRRADTNKASWYDHSRDLIHMINHFRDLMPQPIMGVGHSLGATQLYARLHARPLLPSYAPQLSLY